METLYACSFCHQIFKSASECREHEKVDHVGAKVILDYETNKGMLNAEGKGGICYPNVLKCLLSNGQIGIYHLHDVSDQIKDD